jgi:GNAT superfamily N-acetyltransferase
MEIQQIEEYRITAQQGQQISDLLSLCFPEFPQGQSFLHQAPDFRLLIWENDELKGHLAIEHRLIRVGSEFLRIFGVSDLCIHPSTQDKGYGKQLLQRVATLGKEFHLDFLVLLASEHSFYLQHGFRVVNNPCRWLMIQHGHTLGVNQRHLPDSILVKQLGQKDWPEGVFDFLGHIF